jgi:uncharacterized protein YodC (DUF2158 family)
MTTQNPFQIGDLVQLKSGGPVMTIKTTADYHQEINTVGHICTWYDSDNPGYKSLPFVPETLEIANTQPAAGIATKTPNIY